MTFTDIEIGQGSIAEQENAKLAIQRKMDEAFASVGSTRTGLEVPNLEGVEDIDVLKGLRLAMVDDQEMYMDVVIPHFVAATEGSAVFVLQKPNETMLELAERVAKTNPEFVLVDGQLYDGPGNLVPGVSLIPKLRQLLPEANFIGFASSAPRNDFLKAGAIGFVQKTGQRQEGYLTALAEIVNRVRDEQEAKRAA